MKAYLALSLAFIATIFFFSCSKKEDALTAKGLEWNIKPFSSITIPLEDGNTDDPIHTYLEDYPYKGLDYKVNTKYTGNTTIHRSITITTKYILPSTYNIKLVSTHLYQESNYTIQPVKLNITAYTPTECNDHFFKYIYKNSKHEGDLPVSNRNNVQYHNHMIVKQGNDLSLIMIPVGYWTTDPISTDTKTYSPENELIDIQYDCIQTKITIPKQKISDGKGNTYEIVGEGALNYTKSSYQINYTSNGEPFVIKGLLEQY